MKKAFLDQLFLGFLLLMGIATFVATVSDETSTRNKIYDLKQLSLKTSQAMARSYENNMDMCYGKTIAENILKESTLGKELLALKSDGSINFDYDYYDLLPANQDGSVGDGEPDTVITKITGYKQDNFWYRFFDVDSFTLGEISATDNVDSPKDVTIRYGDRPNASYQNIMGTYELDSNNCITNMQMYMANSKDWNKWEQLSDPSDPNSSRIPIADGITSPPTYVFAIANGYNKFNSPADNAPITLENQHCFGDTTYPKITINGITKQATVGNTNSANVFFEQDELNADGYNHFHIIPKTIIDDYVNYKNNIYTSYGNEKDKYQAFLTYCEGVNTDTTLSNDIGGGDPTDCTEDPNNEYKYALEDLDAAGSDFDFTDMLLDSTRLVKKNDADKYTIDSSQKIVFDSGYCEDQTNTPPTLQLTGCPLTINEDTTTTTDITWAASDSDGVIYSKDISTNYGLAIINANGTITYTPDSNYFGEDTITMVVKDDDDALAKEECYVTIKEVNDNPTITGTPIVSIEKNQLYNFLPEAEDVDGDVLTFSITNKPSWASFNTETGQLTGTPTSSDAGLYENILISVSDGRGGSASLTVFNIEVSDNNTAPKLGEPIPDQTVQEENIFTYDTSAHFSDDDGDTLTYNITAKLDGSSIGWFTINSSSGVITSIEIPNGYVGKVIEITVSVYDGKVSISDTFNLTITNKSEVPSFFHTFDTNTQEWNGNVSWIKYNRDGKLKLTASYTKQVTSMYYSFNFGPEYANKDVTVEFDLYYSGGWESSGNSKDYFGVQLNGDFQGWESYGNSQNITFGPIIKTYNSGETDRNGRISVQIGIYVTSTNEVIFIDNVKVTLQ